MITRPKHWALGVSALTLIAPPAHAQTGDPALTAPASPASPPAQTPASQQPVAAEATSTPTATATPSDDIVVTATRRAERLQDVPIAVSALGSEQIQARKVDSFSEIVKIAPGPTFVPVKGTSVITVQIRGQGTINDSPGLESPVGVYIDDIFYGTLASFDANLFDVSQVSVLRGPQGTTFGRNAVGGALVITNNLPEMGASSGRASVTASDFSGGRGGIEADGFINVPLGDTLAGRFAYGVKDVGGYQRNLQTGHYLANNKVAAYRGSLRWQPSDKWDVVGSLSYLKRGGYGDGPTIVGDGSVGAAVKARTDGDLHKVLLDDDGYTRRTIVAALLNVGYETGIGRVSSITGYRYLKSQLAEDADGGPNPVNYPSLNTNDEWQVSQEFRFTSDLGGPFDFVAGAYFGYEDLNHSIVFGFDGRDPNLYFSVLNQGRYTPGQVFEGQIENRSFGPYAEGKYKLSDKLSLTAGLRYSYERKTGYTRHIGSSPFQGGAYYQQLPANDDAVDSWTGWTPRFIAEYRPVRGSLFYASASRGFQGGGWSFNVRTPAAAATPLKAQTTWSYEIGTKTDLFSRALTLNVAAFHADTSDLQVRSQVDGVFQDSNAGELRARGVEVEAVIRPARGLSFGANYAYTDAFYKSFVGCTAGGLDCTGNQAPFTPKHDFTALLDYTADLANGSSLALHFDTKFASAFQLAPTGLGQRAVPLTERKNVASTSLTYTPPSGRWDVRVWARNLFDKQYVTNGLQYNFYHVTRAEVAATPGGLGALDVERVSVAPPRQIGATLTLRYGK
ncbi:TonB-dependent receptor [Sphingomonas sp. Mn802worker]|uniref:TonB-dependent receptor n=1 Tax=Sphingomonas sp. Mn802worker TaxID=629773 RepID=UPI00037FDF30|nr:TonB-dependent receptor [Sphingomonas sp. Mn802worker]